eukprot:GEZU01005224.1.p1 GENE.GEZU01005224.1~~GEZU01005224.1.p1  ORF type:complete len:262 (+),score=57.42 GEZU01005224.1:97-882(+)
MSSIGTGYDLSSTTYSPDGRLFQVEYAGKAVDNSGNAIGICCKDGVVLGVEKLIISKMLEKGSNRRIHIVDLHAGMANAGLSADARQIVHRGRAECKNYKAFYGSQMPGRTLCERVSGFVHVYTLYWSVRPFGVSTLLAVVDKDQGPQLYCIEPSGASWGYHACAIGKAKQAARTELEKLKPSEMTCREAVKEIARIIYKIHDEVKDKEFELELGWVCEESKNMFQMVPEDIKAEAERLAKEAKAREEEGEEEEEEEGDQE